MKSRQIAVIALMIGAALGVSIATYFTDTAAHPGMDKASTAPESDEPLYWVAPMDPDYKRDKPGKSPMGMDLIPVYAQQSEVKTPPGTVMIDPAVVNNLGIKTVTAQKEKLSPTINTVGYIAFDESQLWQINVRVAGWVEKLYVNTVGEQVRQGQRLFTLYSPDVVKAQQELLNASRSGRTALVEGATERLMTLGVDRPQIQAILKRGRVSSSVEIKAKADGIIKSLNIREGGYLSPAQTVISAGPLNKVWVEAEVFERQSHWVKAGSKAMMTLDAIPGQEWQGQIDYVYPIVDPQTRTLRIRLIFPNPQQALKPNMFANISLQPVSDEAVLTIPQSAVIRSGGMTRVVLADGDGRYRSVRIAVGREAGERIEVLQGLDDQSRVVTSAQFLLDSESSQTAELSRINGLDVARNAVWASGEISDVMDTARMLTISHQPVPDLNWPAMTMNFTLADALDIQTLTRGQSVDFALQRMADGQYQIIDYRIGTSVLPSELWLTGDISMLMADFGMITLQHLPVAEWNWDAGEMNFSVNDDIDLSGLKEGQTVRFLVERKEGDYLLKAIKDNGGQL